MNRIVVGTTIPAVAAVVLVVGTRALDDRERLELDVVHDAVPWNGGFGHRPFLHPCGGLRRAAVARTLRTAAQRGEGETGELWARRGAFGKCW